MITSVKPCWYAASALYVLGDAVMSSVLWSQDASLFGNIVAGAAWPVIVVSALVKFWIASLA